MSAIKKMKPHTCKNHVAVTARGKCVICGSWLCRECVILQHGQFFCKEKCLTNDNAVVISQNTTVSKSSIFPEYTRNNHNVPLSIFLVAITCLLFSAFLGLIQYRNTFKLEAELTKYKENRKKLISVIRSRNYDVTNKDLVEETPQPLEPIAKNVNTAAMRLPSEKIRAYDYSTTKLPLTFDNGSTANNLVSLTFDGDAHVNAFYDIMDTLASRNVNATMFLTGKFIQRKSKLLIMLINNGHEIGSHTWSHPHLTSWAKTHTHITLTNVSERQLKTELLRTANAYKKVVGKSILPLWRAPFGEKNSQICRWAQNAGFVHIGWKQARTWRLNFDTNDWVPDPKTPGYHSPAEVLRKFELLADRKPFGMNGAIILMHLGTLRKEKSQQVHLILGNLIDMLVQKGYAIVTVSEMLKASGVNLSLIETK